MKCERGSETRMKVHNFVQDISALFLGQGDCMSLSTFFYVSCPVRAFSFSNPLSMGIWLPRLGGWSPRAPSGWLSPGRPHAEEEGRTSSLFQPPSLPPVLSSFHPPGWRWSPLPPAALKLVKAINFHSKSFYSSSVSSLKTGPFCHTWITSDFGAQPSVACWKWRTECLEPSPSPLQFPLKWLWGDPWSNMSWKSAKKALLGHVTMGWANTLLALHLLKARKPKTLTESLSELLPDPEAEFNSEAACGLGVGVRGNFTLWGRSTQPLGLSCSAGAGCWAIYLVSAGPGHSLPHPSFQPRVCHLRAFQ